MRDHLGLDTKDVGLGEPRREVPNGRRPRDGRHAPAAAGQARVWHARRRRSKPDRRHGLDVDVRDGEDGNLVYELEAAQSAPLAVGRCEWVADEIVHGEEREAVRSVDQRTIVRIGFDRIDAGQGQLAQFLEGDRLGRMRLVVAAFAPGQRLGDKRCHAVAFVLRDERESLVGADRRPERLTMSVYSTLSTSTGTFGSNPVRSAS